ncbi:MAG: AAA family ATPase [Acidimicrobiia bacterium]
MTDPGGTSATGGRVSSEASMICNNCGAENREGRKFCKDCGTALGLVCPGCGTTNDPGDSFCGECGESLMADASAAVAVPSEAQAAAPATEKRFVSVLFADLVGYTTLSEDRDSEEIRDMLTNYFERAQEIIERFGGAVDKFIGDAVMGVWGATVVQEDDAERAVRAALELVDMVDALGEELDLPDLMLRAGVNSGATAVGPGGNEQGLVVGDLVNVASRLQSIAEPRTVFVGEATESVTNRSIDYRYQGERSVKGKSETVPAWRALRVASMVGGRDTDDIRQPPFVGREREMRLIKDALSGVESEGRARLVSIIGEAGIGKSRLADEFKNHVDGFTHDVYWHQGRSPSYAEGLTFWALGEMVRQRAGILETEEPARAMIRLRTTVADFVPSEDDRQWIEPKLAGLLGLAEMPPGTRSELFSALRAFFQNIAERGPTVLVFEDLHWADDGLLEFITELVERSTRSPLFVVTLARSDLLERQPGWGSQHRNSLGLRLPSLSESEMTRLLSEYLPGLPDDVIDSLADRTAGIPLYAVEIVRMLVASGELESVDGQYRFNGDADSMTLPESLQAVIGARIDRLTEEERSVLQDASVLGQSFTLEALAAMRGADPTEVESALRRLVQAEVLDIEDDPRSPERGQYHFLQSLIREVAYGRLSRPDRREKHLAVAAHFEGIDDPELAGVVAGHIMGAYEASPQGPERDALAAQALNSVVDAADRALVLHSYSQALNLLDASIGLAMDPAKRADLQLRAALVARNAGEVERGLDYAADVLDHSTADGDVTGIRRAATARSDILNSNYRSAEALEAIEGVYLDLENVDDPITAHVAAEAGRSYMLNHRLDEAIDAIERLLPVAEREGLTELTLTSLVTQATAFGQVNRPVEARTVLQGVAAVAEDAGLLMTAMRAYNNLASILLFDDPVSTMEMAEHSGEILSRLGDHRWGVRYTWDRAFDDWDNGRYGQALSRLDTYDPEDLSEWWQHSWNTGRTWVDLLRTGDPDLHLRMIEALSFFADETDQQIRVGIDSWQCDVEAAVGRWDQAYDLAMTIDDPWGSAAWRAAQAGAWTHDLQRVEAVIQLAEPIEPRRARMLRGLRMYLGATRAALQGDLAEASRVFRELIALWDGVAFLDDLTCVRATFAMLVGQDDPAAASAAQDAYDWLSETGTSSLISVYADGLPQVAAAEAATR